MEKKKQSTQNKKSVNLLRRPYGLLKKAGISTDGMTPRQAWNTWDKYAAQHPNTGRKARTKTAPVKKSRQKPVTKQAPVYADLFEVALASSQR